MKRFRSAIWLALLIAPYAAQSAQIVLVYPRTESAIQVYTYARNVDSTFVLGRVEPPAGQLFINGISVSLDAGGAFLAWLPLRNAAASRSWDLVLMQNGAEVASVTYPYAIASDTAIVTADTSRLRTSPRVVRVTIKNAHARTAPDGTYHVFPDSGCKLVAIGREAGYLRVRIADGLDELIEPESVAFEPDSALAPALLRNGGCSSDSTRVICRIAISRPVPWTSQLSADSRVLDVMLYDIKAGMNRMRYDVRDSLLQDIVWEQTPLGVSLQFRFRTGITNGYEIGFERDSLQVTIRRPFAKPLRSLRGKLVVLDPGHGGRSAGSIGPLGTKEKDVVLRWAQILGKALRDKGAVVKFTREDDTDVALYDRVEFARRAGADFFLSLHCNALPDTENPLVRHGSGTYYYQSESRPAAEILHRQLLAASKLRDDGLYDANLAVVRPIAFPAALIEAAYLIYPPEEQLLMSDDFLRALAQGITRGLNEYFQRVP